MERLVRDLEAQRLARRQSAQRLIAELLIDCAACRRQVAGDAAAETSAIAELRQAVRQREQRCVEALLTLYAFRTQDAAASDLPLLDGRWGDDLFNPETLKQLGVKVGSGIAAGAAAGAGVDLLVGGLTLGAAALAGAIAGGALQTARGYGGRLLGKLKERATPAGTTPTATAASLGGARSCGAGQHHRCNARGQVLARGQAAASPGQGPSASAMVVAQPTAETEPDRTPGTAGKASAKA